MRTHDKFGDPYTTFEPDERVALVVGRRVGTVQAGEPVIDREHPTPFGVPKVTQLVRWDPVPTDPSPRPIPWPTWTLRPAR